MAAGEPWLGHFATLKGPVVAIDEENPLALLKERYSLLTEGLGLPMTADVHLVAGQGLDLCNPEDVDALREFLWEKGPGLLTLDSYRRVHSGKEDGSTEMAEVQKVVSSLASDIGCTVVIAHHTRKFSEASNRADQRVRGSSDIVASADTVVSVSRTANGLRASHVKSRAGPEVPAFTIALQVEGNAAQLAYLGEAPKEQDGKAERAGTLVLDMLREKSLQRKEIISAGKAEKLSGATMDSALSRLKASGQVESDGRRPASYSLISESYMELGFRD